MDKNPIERLRKELTRPPLFSERNGYEPLDRAPLLDILDEIEARYMKLPMGADGVPIKPGQTLYEIEYNDEIETKHYREIPGCCVYGVSDKRVYIWNYDNDRRIIGVYANELTHDKPDTVESIIMEAMQHAFGVSPRCETLDMGDKVNEYAERIRKAVEND